MSFIDKILDKMSLNSEDDEEFDNEDYYLDDEEEEELPRNLFRRKKEAAEEEPAIKSTRRDTTPKEKPVKTTSKITPISKSSRKQVSSDMEVCVIKPSSIEDEIEITDTLLNGRTVVINMEGLNVDVAQADCYFIKFSDLKISNFIFIATPHGVDISGDIQSLMDSFDLPGSSY